MRCTLLKSLTLLIDNRESLIILCLSSQFSDTVTSILGRKDRKLSLHPEILLNISFKQIIRIIIKVVHYRI